MALHTDKFLGEIEVLPGVFYSVRVKHVERLVQRPTGPFKILDSHVGWGPWQLERFVEEGGWKVLPATPEQVFHAGPDLWEQVSKLVEWNAAPGPS